MSSFEFWSAKLSVVCGLVELRERGLHAREPSHRVTARSPERATFRQARCPSRLSRACVAARRARLSRAAPARPPTRRCLPFPDDRFTVAADTPTGRRARAAAGRACRRTGSAGRSTSPTSTAPTGSAPARRSSSRSRASTTLAGLPPHGRCRRSTTRSARCADDSPVAVIDARTGRQHLVWAELDLNAADDADRTLIVRPAKNFDEGARYVVVLRDLRDAHGPPRSPAHRGRAPRRATCSGVLQRAGVPSRRPVPRVGLHGRQRAEHDRPHARDPRPRVRRAGRHEPRRPRGRGPRADRRRSTPTCPTTRSRRRTPEIGRRGRAVDGIVDFARGPDRRARSAASSRPVLPRPARAARPARSSSSAPTGTPTRIPGNTDGLRLHLQHPADATASSAPALYGHGLFGGQGEIDQGQLKDLSFEHGFLFCAVDWNGMAFKDVPNAVTVLQDLSRASRRSSTTSSRATSASCCSGGR